MFILSKKISFAINIHLSVAEARVLPLVVRRIYFTVELYSFSFSRKYSSDFMVFPSDNLIIYGLPVIMDLEAHSLMKSSAVWTATAF
jgi:hypothetical protein